MADGLALVRVIVAIAAVIFAVAAMQSVDAKVISASHEFVSPATADGY